MCHGDGGTEGRPRRASRHGDPDCALRAITSRPEWFFTAPDAESLADLYRAIAGTIPCPPAAFWGGRRTK
jgi:hypothetical protein